MSGTPVTVIDHDSSRLHTLGRRQASSNKAILRARSRNPPSLLDRALNQLVECCQLTLQNAAILAIENSELRAAIEE